MPGPQSQCVQPVRPASLASKFNDSRDTLRGPSAAARRLFWGRYAACYDSLWDNPLSAEVADVICSQLTPGQDVVEVGAGTGIITQHLLARGHRVVATEPEPAMRHRLRSRLPTLVVSDERCEELAGSDTPKSVVAVNVVHMTSEPDHAVLALRRAAGQGGSALVVTPHPNATLLSVSRAMLSAGTSSRAVVRFMATHTLLAPLTTMARIGIRPLPHTWADASRQQIEIRGVQILATFDGIGVEDTPGDQALHSSISETDDPAG